MSILNFREPVSAWSHFTGLSENYTGSHGEECEAIHRHFSELTVGSDQAELLSGLYRVTVG